MAGTTASFRPHVLLRSGQLQTILASLFPGRLPIENAIRHEVPLADGDRIVLHDDCPPHWQPADPAALLMHGLAGCHRSGYMVRIAEKLQQRGVRVFRMDHRGCGAGQGLARNPYNAGRSDDARRALEFIADICPESPVAVAGFSLSGNVLLKMLGECPAAVPRNVTCAVSVNAPIQLEFCVAAIQRTAFGIYDRHFASLLYRMVRNSPQWRADLPIAARDDAPKRLFDFDNLFTAPASGFPDAPAYYAAASAGQFIPAIQIRTLILTARDDPMVPVVTYDNLTLPDHVTLRVEDHGGHLGYISADRFPTDRRWLDQIVVDWMTNPGTVEHAALIE